MAQTAATRAIENAISQLNKVIQKKNEKMAAIGDELVELKSQRDTLVSTLPPAETAKK
jgi:predicted  nucleic acid-binding Zn-ribbon protein